jgi:hypothetical protein
LSQVFRVFYTPLAINPETSDALIMTACCLHNLLRDAYLEDDKRNYYSYDPSTPKPTENFIPLSRHGGYTNLQGFAVRDDFKKYFNSRHGSLDWQNKAARASDTVN